MKPIIEFHSGSFYIALNDSSLFLDPIYPPVSYQSEVFPLSMDQFFKLYIQMQNFS